MNGPRKVLAGYAVGAAAVAFTLAATAVVAPHAASPEGAGPHNGAPRSGAETDGRRAADVAATTVSNDDPDPVPRDDERLLESGTAEIVDGVGELRAEVAPITDPSTEGAVTAFAMLATWVLVSPAARAEPQLAAKDVTADAADPATVATLTNMERTDDDDFRPDLGAYRVLGVSGDSVAPEAVMVEIVGPLTTASGTRWVVIGGVVTWTGSEWKVFSLAPRELAQQPAASRSLRERAASPEWLDGLGWRTFADADSQPSR
jgi:hypothetical protein